MREGTIERRYCSTRMAPVRVESRAGGSGKTMTGYGAVFYNARTPGTQYRLFEDIYERIAPTAFDRAIREKHDARGLFNHDPSLLLGRVASRTMRLSVDSRGLRYEIDLPETELGRSVAVAIERGDLTGSSFAFISTGTVWTEENGISIREITDLDLFDTGPVTYPAYEATTAGLREIDIEAIRREMANAGASRDGEAEAIAIRLRLIEIDSH